MKRKNTDLFDEYKNINIDSNSDFKYGISVLRDKKPKKLIINASALKLLGAKIVDYLIDILRKEFCKYFKIDNYKKILIIGLGNNDIINDSLGPCVVQKLLVTRGLNYQPEVSVFSPNVFSNTGIETRDIVKSMVDIVKPELVLLIDSLATLSISRLCTCFQIIEEGITPGNANFKKNKKIDKNFLGVKKIISIGVPMLIYAESIVKQNKTSNDLKDLILSPCDVKKNIEILSEIISKALNLAIFKDFSEDEIEALTKL